MAIVITLARAPILPSDALSVRDARDGEIQPRQFGTVTVELRRGHLGYDGIRDTFLAGAEPSTPHGMYADLQIKENQPYRRALMYYDLSAIPPGATVTSAWLDLFVYYRSSTNATTYGFYYLLRPWDESTATWNSSGYANWATPGAGGAYTDYDPASFTTSALSDIKKYNRVNVLPAVQRWIQHPETNFGLMVMGSSSIDVRFWSSDWSIDLERPRLILTYETTGAETPQPTVSPTTGPSPTPGPSPTAQNIIYSVGAREAFDERDPANCTIAYPDQPGNAEVLLVWQGTPTYAKLSLLHQSNNDRRHSVLVNGVFVGKLPGPNYRTKCGDAVQASLAEFTFDPSLVQNGVNTITILADQPGEIDGWSMMSPRIELGGAVQGSEIQVVSLVSSYDRTTQRAMIQKPAGYVPGEPVPLVLSFHGWGGRDLDALKAMAAATSARGWLLACPDTRNDSEHTPSKEVQRDVLDLLQYMTTNPAYTVDQSRIYIMGKSMGGMMASVIAAKYPHRFAALADLKGPTRLDSWYWEVESWRRNVLYKELGGAPNTAPFAYERRSAALMAMNLSNIPTIIIHGTQDTVVAYHHATDLASAMSAANARYVQVYPFTGGHDSDHPDWGPEQILSFFANYISDPRPLAVKARTDEPNVYYWLGITYNNTDHWSQVQAHLDPGQQVVTLDVYDERVPSATIYVNLDLVKMGLPTGVSYTVEDTNLATGAFEQYQVQADSTLRLTVVRDRHHLVVQPFVAPAPQSVTLRQGEEGYYDVHDTYIDTFDKSTSHGSDDRMTISNNGNRTVMIRFGLDQVPPNIAVKAAQLQVYAQYRWGTGTKLATSVHGLLRSWYAAESNWLQATTTQPWLEAGAWAPDQDYELVASSQGEMSDIAKWYSYNVTDLVRRWLANPSTNYGILLRGGEGSSSFQLASSESSTVSYRPALVIVYGIPTPTPTVVPTIRLPIIVQNR